MKYINFIFALFIGCLGLNPTDSSAQGYFNFGYGVSVTPGGVEEYLKKGTDTDVATSISVLSLEGVYVPRYQFYQQGDNFGLGVAGYLQFGFGICSVDSRIIYKGSNPYENTNSELKNTFAVGLPIVAEASFGAGATEDSEQAFGAFGGIGLDSRYYFGDVFTDVPSFVYGPTITGGIRFGFSTTYLTLRGAYTVPLVESWKNYMTFQMLLHFY